MCQNKLDRIRKAAPESCFINCMKTLKVCPEIPQTIKHFLPGRSIYFNSPSNKAQKSPPVFFLKPQLTFELSRPHLSLQRLGEETLMRHVWWGGRRLQLWGEDERVWDTRQTVGSVIWNSNGCFRLSWSSRLVSSAALRPMQSSGFLQDLYSDFTGKVLESRWQHDKHFTI